MTNIEAMEVKIWWVEVKERLDWKEKKYEKKMNGLDFASTIVGITFCKLLVVYLIVVYIYFTNIAARPNLFAF